MFIKQGEIVAGVLDYLAKERVRIAEEIQIANMVFLSHNFLAVHLCFVSGQTCCENPSSS